MNGYDLVILLIMVIAAVQGAWRGMSWQLAPIASLVLGYMIAFPASQGLAPWFGQPPYNRLLALVTIYLVIALGVYMIARSIRTTIENFKLVEFDRHVGILLGLAKGVLFSLALTFLVLAVAPSSRDYVLPSYSGHVAAVLMDYAHPLIPDAMHNILHPYVDELGQARRDDAADDDHSEDWPNSPFHTRDESQELPSNNDDSVFANQNFPLGGFTPAQPVSGQGSATGGGDYEELDRPPTWLPPSRSSTEPKIDWEETGKAWEAETERVIGTFLKEAARLPRPQIRSGDTPTTRQ